MIMYRNFLFLFLVVFLSGCVEMTGAFRGGVIGPKYEDSSELFHVFDKSYGQTVSSITAALEKDGFTVVDKPFGLYVARFVPVPARLFTGLGIASLDKLSYEYEMALKKVAFEETKVVLKVNLRTNDGSDIQFSGNEAYKIADVLKQKLLYGTCRNLKDSGCNEFRKGYQRYAVADKRQKKRPPVKMAAQPKGFDPVVYRGQEQLLELGYNPGKADGLMGPRTRAAIKKFQENEQLELSGLFDEQTVERLDSYTIQEPPVEEYFVEEGPDESSPADTEENEGVTGESFPVALKEAEEQQPPALAQEPEVAQPLSDEAKPEEVAEEREEAKDAAPLVSLVEAAELYPERDIFSQPVAFIPYGDKVKILRQEDGWFFIAYKEQRGFIPDYLFEGDVVLSESEPAREAPAKKNKPKEKVVKASDVEKTRDLPGKSGGSLYRGTVLETTTLLSEPSIMADALGEVAEGTTFEKMEKVDDFFRVTYQGKTGFVYIDFVEFKIE